MDTRNKKFHLLSTFQQGLIRAEEAYLLEAGWKLVTHDGGHSTWKHPRYILEYSRNHAIMIAKAQDENLGYW